MADFDSKLWVTIGDGPPARVVLMRGMGCVARLRPAEARANAAAGKLGSTRLPAEVCRNLELMADEIEERKMPV